MGPKDYGAGRLNATNVGRACRYGRWLSISSRQYGNRLTNGSLVTYVTLHIYFRSLTKKGDVNRMIISKITQATNCEQRKLTSETQNGKLYQRVHPSRGIGLLLVLLVILRRYRQF